MPIVRPAEPQDLAVIMTFDSFPGDRIVEIIERRILVVEADGLVRGYVAWQTGGCFGNDYINKLVIDDGSRRLGFARLLLSGVEAKFSGRVFISIPVGNRAALELLKTAGWLKAGELIGSTPSGESQAFFFRDV